MPDRPTRAETCGILVACAAALAMLTWVDDATVRQHHARAAPSVQARAVAAPLVGSDEVPAVLPSRPPATVAADEVPGRAMALGWLWLVALGGIGMCAAGVRALSRRSA